MTSPLAIRISNLSFSYPAGTQALRGIYFEIPHLDRVALLGANGAGKSTLLLHFNGLLQGQGVVEILGQPITARTLRTIREQVGLVFQDPDNQLFCPTLEEDVAFGPANFGVYGESLRARVDQALGEVGLLHKRKSMPSDLSFGEKKRGAMATIIACQPHIYALDEPSANLDPRHRRQLIRWLRSVNATVICATHDLDLALETSTRCIILEEGSVVADGPSRRILTDQKLLEQHGLELPLSFQRNIAPEEPPDFKNL